jgi:hypothetical protein
MSSPEKTIRKSEFHDSEPDAQLAQIRESLHGLRFGSVNIIVQDGVIVQIERTEKRRVQRREEKQ